MRISDWSSDVCSSDLDVVRLRTWLANPDVTRVRGDGLSGQPRPGPVGFRAEYPLPRLSLCRAVHCAIRTLRFACRLQFQCDRAIVAPALQPDPDRRRPRRLSLGHPRHRKRDVKGKSMSVRVDLVGRVIIEKKK